MSQSTKLPNLDGLIALARRDGVDVRPTLLRVLADLYVQKRTHTPDEQHRFTELALWLLASVDVPTRAAVARTLAACHQVPHTVIRRLARDVFEVAEPVLRGSNGLTGEDLVAIIQDFGPRYAAAIAERGAPVAIKAEDQARSTVPDAAAVPAASVPMPSAPAPEPVRAPMQRRIERPHVALGEHFLAAGSAERRLLLANLQDGTLTPAERAFATSIDEAIQELEAAALQRRPDRFVDALEHFLHIPRIKAEQIVHDETGEPLVVAARAFAIPSDVLLRILLFLNPVIGHSVDRVFDLMDFYEGLGAEAALHIVSSWQAEHARRTGRHQPVLWNDERSGARRAASEQARRPLERRSLTAQPDERAARAR